MNWSEYGSFLLLVYSATVGAFLGVLWDVFRIIRIAFHGRKTGAAPPVRLPSTGEGVERALSFKHGTKIPSLTFFGTFLCDLIFCLICAVCVVLLLFQLNDGEVRMFSLLGALAGFAVYYFTVGRLTVYFSDVIIKAVKKTVYTVLRFTLFPVIRAASSVLNRAKRIIKNRQRRKLTAKYIKNTLKNAKNGFDIS